MNRYYLVDYGNARSQRLQQIRDALQDGINNRIATHQILHYRENLLNTKVIIQAEVTQAEHDQIIGFRAGGQNFITYLGDYQNGTASQSVHDYIDLNRSEWELQVNI